MQEWGCGAVGNPVGHMPRMENGPIVFFSGKNCRRNVYGAAAPESP